jgi:hypothetical protein
LLDCDKVSKKLLKIISPFIRLPHNEICNKVLFKGIYPDRLKFSIIKLLYNKGNKKDICNYRPIFLLTSYSKILGKVMHTRLLEHLFNSNILSREQYGFWMRLTSENATSKLINEILTALNNKLMVGGIFCEFERAYDFVNHDILLLKLQDVQLKSGPYFNISN